MLIREIDGFYKGQVREFPSHVAFELIAAGRAENPFAESSTDEPPTPETVVVSKGRSGRQTGRKAS